MLSYLLFFICILISSFIFTTQSYNNKCLLHQEILLLQLRDELIFNSSLSTKLVQWNERGECCKWPGVECDASGYVVRLQLDEEAISGGIGDSSSPFRFKYLQKLNLAFNDFNHTHPIPKGIGNFTYLTHLNMSRARFGGQVPVEISSLKRLVSLDISNYNCWTPREILTLAYPNLEMLVRNLTGLRELYLDCVNIITSFHQRNKWSHIVSSHLPNLTALSLHRCSLPGHLASSFWKLHSLSILRLDYANLSTVEVSDFFTNFPSLTVLSLSNCSLKGSIPSTFAYLTKLIHVNLAYNFLTGSLSSTLFEGLSNLAHLNLTGNSLPGNIPRSLYALPSLLELSVSLNQFNGTFKLDNLLSLTNLTYLGLSQNSLSVDVGKVDSSSYERFQLKVLALGSCNLSNIPNFIIHSHIEILELSDNRIAGEIPNWIWGTQLWYLDLSSNLLTDFQKPYHIPASLKYLYLDSNQLRGELQLPIPLESQLWYLSLANNSLSGSIPTFLCNTTHLDFLTLSENKLSGSIPPCLLQNVRGIDVDQNKVSGTIPDHFPSHCRLEYLYLNNNNMEGKIPKSLKNCGLLKSVDIGNNNISGNIPDIFSMDCKLQYLSLSNNNLEGKIPKSLKSCMSLEIMDVGNNYINNTFPCMLSSSLRVLILHSNKFHGEVTCNMNWSMLQILDISSNNFSGRLKSINFSSWRGMMEWSYAQSYVYGVKLILKGIELKLEDIWPEFGSIDFSCNNFIGEIPNAIGDLTTLHLLNLSHNAINGSIPESFGQLSNLESLDLSVNQLTGPIPQKLGELTFLEVLNLSYNKLVGEIPKGRQIQTFSAESFEGNSGLCGFLSTQTAVTLMSYLRENMKMWKRRGRLSGNTYLLHSDMLWDLEVLYGYFYSAEASDINTSEKLMRLLKRYSMADTGEEDVQEWLPGTESGDNSVRIVIRVHLSCYLNYYNW